MSVLIHEPFGRRCMARNEVITPPNSPVSEHRQLRRAAQADGQDDAPLREILWLTNAHYKLIALPRVAATLSGILIENAAAWGNILSNVFENADAKIQSWVEALLWVQRYAAQERSRFIASLHVHPRPGVRVRDPIHGHLSQRHPLYTALWETHGLYPDAAPNRASNGAIKAAVRGPLESPLSSDSRINELHKRYRRLVGHMTMGHIVLFGSTLTRETYEGYAEVGELTPGQRKLYNIFLSLRQLLPKERSAIAYLHELNALEDPRKFLTYNLNLEQAAKILPVKHRDVMSFLKVALNSESWITRSHSSREGTVRGWWIPDKKPLGKQNYVGTVNLGDDDDPDCNWGVVDNISHIGGNDRKRETALTVDDDPMGDDVDDTTTLPVPSGKDGISNPTIGWAQVCHLEMHNQFLPWDLGALSPGEVWKLLQAVKSFEGTTASRYTSQQRNEIISFLLTMLLTGSSMERALSLQVVAKDVTLKNGALGICLSEKPAAWVVPALTPSYRRIKVPVKGLERPLTETVHLPDVLKGSRWIRRLISAHSGPLFSAKQSIYQEVIRCILSKTH